MKLYTTDDDLRTAHLIAHKGRARNIELPRVLVKHILMDHHKLFDIAEKSGERLEKGKP